MDFLSTIDFAAALDEEEEEEAKNHASRYGRLHPSQRGLHPFLPSPSSTTTTPMAPFTRQTTQPSGFGPTQDSVYSLGTTQEDTQDDFSDTEEDEEDENSEDHEDEEENDETPNGDRDENHPSAFALHSASSTLLSQNTEIQSIAPSEVNSDESSCSSLEEDEEEDYEEGKDGRKGKRKKANGALSHLPAHACAYCGCGDPAAVVQCGVGRCGKWFCNGRGSTAGSHAIHHCIRSKHKEVVLHPEGLLGDTTLECFVCGNKNVFVLGFVPSCTESVVILLCRDPCLGTSQAGSGTDWDPSTWLPLIEDRKLLPWLVKSPSAAEMARCRKITTEQIVKLEELWKTNPQGSIEDLNPAQASRTGPLESVCFFYEDAYHYQAVFTPLIEMEAAYDEAMKASQAITNATISWTPGISGKTMATFVFPRADSDTRLVVGDEIRIIHPSEKLAAENQGKLSGVAKDPTLGVLSRAVASKSGKSKSMSLRSSGATLNESIALTLEQKILSQKWQQGAFDKKPGDKKEKGEDEGLGVVGTVVRINVTPTSTDEITVELKPTEAQKVHTELTHGYICEMVWKPVTFERMKQAMRVFAADESSVSAYLYHRLLGHAVEHHPTLPVDLPKTLHAPSLPKLNPSQAAAVRSVLPQPLSLIQGPPGTGKTVTSATLVYHMASLNKTQVLVTAPSNVAVDHLAERIAKTGLRVVRMCARSRESVLSVVEPLTLHAQVESLATNSPQWSELYKLRKLRDVLGHLSTADEHKYVHLLRKMESELLRGADVVCTTCVGSGDSRLGRFRFKHVLIDESTQSCEPETLLALVRGARQVVLVGDHCQLGPVILCKEATKAGLGRSLFERLVLLGVRPYRLQVQYRMHPAISAFPSATFYEGTLQNGVTQEERLREEHPFPWPCPHKPLFFYNSIGAEELSGSGTSYLNRVEGALVEKCVTQLLQVGVLPDDVGIITPYEGQRAYVVHYLQRNGTLPSDLYKRIEVSSVDAFQGREKQYIILSCVRSNDHQGIGFLSDARRLNVALTRAQSGLIIIGNGRVLSRSPLWHALISHYKAMNLVVEGPLSGLKAVNLTLQRPYEIRSGLFRTQTELVAGVGGAKEQTANVAVPKTAMEAAPEMYDTPIDGSYSRALREGGRGEKPSAAGGEGVGGTREAALPGLNKGKEAAGGKNNEQTSPMATGAVPYHPRMTPAAQAQSYVKALETHLRKQPVRESEGGRGAFGGGRR